MVQQEISRNHWRSATCGRASNTLAHGPRLFKPTTTTLLKGKNKLPSARKRTVVEKTACAQSQASVPYNSIAMTSSFSISENFMIVSLYSM